MKTTIEKLREKIQKSKNEEISLEIHDNLTASLVILNEAPYYSLLFNNENTYIHLTSLWRAVINSKIIFTSEDDKQMFGLKKPFDVQEAFKEHFSSKKISKIKIRNPIADMQIIFQDGSYIELFATSAGYENWIMSGKEIQIICLGGGELAVF